MSYKEIADLMRETEQKLITEFLKDIEKGLCSCGCGDIVCPIGDQLVEKWEKRLWASATT